MVGCRTQLVNHVRGAVKSFGARLPKCPARSFHKRASEHIPEALLPALGPILEQIGSLTRAHPRLRPQLETISKERYPETDLLRQVEGIGPLTALTFVLTLEDPYRFEKSRSVGAYLGLVPATDQSGDRDPQKRISKEGDEMLRKLLVGSAHYILGPFGSGLGPQASRREDSLSGRQERKETGGGGRGRKLAVLLHRLWVTGELYDPLYNAHRRQEQRRRQLKERRWSQMKQRGGEDTLTQRRGDPKVADGNGSFLPECASDLEGDCAMRTWSYPPRGRPLGRLQRLLARKDGSHNAPSHQRVSSPRVRIEA